jgi:hydrogenase maturation protease
VKPILVLCLGNDIIADDGFGPAVAQKLNGGKALPEQVEVLFAPLAGFALLDLLRGRQAVLVVDAIVTGRAQPGHLHFFPAADLVPSHNLVGSHQINLPTALKLGVLMGMDMPVTVDLLAAEAADVQTLTEQLTPPVAAAVAEAVKRVENWIAEHTLERSYEISRISA